MGELLSQLGSDVLLSSYELARLIRSSPRRYKVYTIAKKNKNERRTIAQPAREVKVLQRWLIRHLLDALPVHEAATAYRRGLGISTNAARHTESSYLLKLDFKDFFPSIKATDFQSYAVNLERRLDPVELEAITRILFWRPKGEKVLRLSIGAPSSPLLSNILMYDFDERVARRCKEMGVVYTRYADDITFSAEESDPLRQIEEFVVWLCRTTKSPRLRLNDKKTVRVSKRRSRRVTGLVITNDRKVSMGRTEKRLISAQVHRFSMGKLDQKERLALQGMLGYVKSVEPSFLDRLRGKYGPAVVQEIQRQREQLT